MTAAPRLVDLTHPFTEHLPTFGDERPSRKPYPDGYGGLFIPWEGGSGGPCRAFASVPA